MKNLSENIVLLAYDDDVEQLEIFDLIFKEKNIQHYVLCYTKEKFYSNLTPGVNFCILDDRLNDTTGLEVTKEVKKMNKDNYVMVYSATRDFDVVVEYINAKADRFVKKNGDINNQEFIESLRIGFTEAQERIRDAQDLADYKVEKEKKLMEHTSNLIDVIDRGNK